MIEILRDAERVRKCEEFAESNNRLFEADLAAGFLGIRQAANEMLAILDQFTPWARVEIVKFVLSEAEAAKDERNDKVNPAHKIAIARELECLGDAPPALDPEFQIKSVCSTLVLAS